MVPTQAPPGSVPTWVGASVCVKGPHPVFQFTACLPVRCLQLPLRVLSDAELLGIRCWTPLPFLIDVM